MTAWIVFRLEDSHLVLCREKSGCKATTDAGTDDRNSHHSSLLTDNLPADLNTSTENIRIAIATVFQFQLSANTANKPL
jgi:F420-0:gamma-glutamyl ligase